MNWHLDSGQSIGVRESMASACSRELTFIMMIILCLSWTIHHLAKMIIWTRCIVDIFTSIIVYSWNQGMASCVGGDGRVPYCRRYLLIVCTSQGPGAGVSVSLSVRGVRRRRMSSNIIPTGDTL